LYIVQSFSFFFLGRLLVQLALLLGEALIFQQVVLAQKIIVVSGAHSIPFEELEAVAPWIRRL